MKKISKALSVTLSVALSFSLIGPGITFAATDPGLATSQTFSIIGQTTITGTGTTSGNVGLNSTGAGITALTSGMVGGTIYSTDGVAPSTAILDPNVQSDLSTANDNISGQGLTSSIGPVLDDLSLVTGVYDIGAGRLNGGVLTLDGPGIYIFRASSDFISSGSINLTNGARACDVYWQVNTLATINGSSFVGTIIAGTGVHFGPNVTLDGRAQALGGDVTLLDNAISGPTCETPVIPEPEPEPEPRRSSSSRRGSKIRPQFLEQEIVPQTVVIESVVPKLPNAGINPDDKSVSWNFIIPTGIFMTLIAIYSIRRKKTA